MLLFVGLGNPGAKYAHNRHNIGFMAVDEVPRRHGFGPWRRVFQGETAEGTLDGERVVLLKPATFMNESGRAVQEAASFFKLGVGDVTVFQDELELPPAQGRGAAGGGCPAIMACFRSPRISATNIAACGSESVTPASRSCYTATCWPILPRTK